MPVGAMCLGIVLVAVFAVAFSEMFGIWSVVESLFRVLLILGTGCLAGMGIALCLTGRWGEGLPLAAVGIAACLAALSA